MGGSAAGQPDRARRLFAAALCRSHQLGDIRGIAYDLEGIAAVAAMDRSARQALILRGAAQRLRDDLCGPRPPIEQAILDRILAPAIDTLAARERDDALAQGRNQPLADTIANALRAGEPH